MAFPVHNVLNTQNVVSLYVFGDLRRLNQPLSQQPLVQVKNGFSFSGAFFPDDRIVISQINGFGHLVEIQSVGGSIQKFEDLGFT
ncbi:MAG: hypothetical protein KCHDKBKB_02399 [Elusimicrobia bacterium]|nr:hypothetical protein [Elusimicrobiota bacterium]